MSFATIATIALAASASLVRAAPIVARNETSVPSSYAEGYLEDYDVYHARYLALDCKTQHNTTFFDDCCHPLLANETLADDRLPYCSPNATTSSSVASSIAEYTETATASATATADVEAESEYSSAVTSVEEAASTASYYYANETASATASATDSVTATTTASVDNAEAWAYKSSSSSSSSSRHHHSSSTATAAATSATAEAEISVEASVEVSTSSTEESYTPTSTSTSTAAAATTSSSSSSDVMTGGYATYFYQDGVAGECGTVHSDSDYIIAIDANGWWSDYETNDDSPYCGKSITITNTNNGKSVTAVVADVCPTCDTNNSLDLSVGAFTAIASESDGQVPITWVWA